MIQFRNTQADGYPMGRQATKTDLVDMARALGVLTASDEMSVDDVRALIRTKLPTFAPKSSRQATKADLLGIARGLGLEASSRQSAEELREWIRTYLNAAAAVPATRAECEAAMPGFLAPAKPAPEPAAKPAEIMFHVPERPYTPIDALNRSAAALGSPGYAQGAAHASYNGHRVSVQFNTYRKYWTAEYFWAGRVVLGRGSFETCLDAALREFDRGAVGAEVVVHLVDGHWSASGEELERALARCKADPRLVAGREPKENAWYTWRHRVAAQSARDYAHPGASARIFDWELMQAVETEEAYTEAVRAKHGRVYQ